MKVLIADDSSFMRGIIKSMVQKEISRDITIVEAENGTETIKLYYSERPDMILLDLIMPEKDGLAVLKEIGRSAKVVVISAAGQEQMLEEAKALGAKDFIQKPFDFKSAGEKIKALI